MLQSIRDKASGWVASIALGAIAVVFIFWGVDFQSNANTFAAKVDGTKISAETVRNAWQRRQSQLQQMMRGELPPELAKAQQQAILDEQIRSTLLTQRADKLGYRIGDEELANRIREFPELQVDGKFSRDRYAMLLRQQGRTEPQFEADLRSNMAIVQLQSGVMQSAFVLPYELERRFALEKQEREINYALIATNDFSAGIDVTDEQIQSWYDSHKDDYLLPETVDLQYVELTRAKAEAAVTVEEAELKEYYDQVKEKYESPERRHARHVLVTAGDGLDEAAASKKAEEIAAQAKSGADFAELAKQNSRDPGSAQQGGDLGWAERGMFVGPFEDALFSMQPGDIVGPVKTQFGYHIIKLEGVEKGQVRSFEDVRPELEVEYRKDRSQSIFYDESQKLADLGFASLTELDSVAAQLGLEMKTIPGFTREGGGELGDDPGVIDAAFSDEVLEQGHNSPLLAIGEDRAIVLRVANHKPAEPRPLSEVRAQIDAQLRIQGARDAANAKAASAVAKLQQGASWSAVASELALTPVGSRFVTRADSIAPAAVVRAAFAAAATAVSAETPFFGTTTTDDGNVAVFSLSDIRPGDPASESANERTVRQRRAEQESGGTEFAAYVAEAERNAKIVRNDKVFE